MDRQMADEPLLETDNADVIRFLRSGVGFSTHPDLHETQSAMNLLIRQINAQPTGVAAAGVWSALIRLFLQQTKRATNAIAEPKNALKGRTVGDIMTRDPWTARPDQTLSELVNQLFLAHAITFAPVVEDDVLLGYVDFHMVQRIDRENWTNATVEDVIESVGPDNSVSPNMLDDDLFARIAQTGRRKSLVVFGQTLVGVVTLSDLTSYLGASRQLPQSPTARA
jgi:CBS domain-containing protein